MDFKLSTLHEEYEMLDVGKGASQCRSGKKREHDRECGEKCSDCHDDQRLGIGQLLIEFHQQRSNKNHKYSEAQQEALMVEHYFATDRYYTFTKRSYDKDHEFASQSCLSRQG